MEALSLALVSNSQPQSLEQWNARYEAMSVECDWWFKAGVAIAAWFRARLERPSAKQAAVAAAPHAAAHV
jgi:hypothetical protein